MSLGVVDKSLTYTSPGASQMGLGEVDKALISFRDQLMDDLYLVDHMNNPPPYQSRIEDPYLFGHIFDEETGSVMTHRMAQMDNYAFPMIQYQRSGPDIGTLKDFGDDKFGAWEAAKKAGNYKKFNTDIEAQEYAEGGYKTPELEYYGKVESKHARTGNRQSVEPDYGPQGLRNVAPLIELGFGLGGMAIRSSKAFSDKVVDKWNKFRTPDEVYTGGPIGLKTLRTPYDVAKADARFSPPTSSYEGYQAGSYSAANLDEAKAYAMAARHAAEVKGPKLDRAGEGPGPSSMAETAKIARLKTGSGVYKIDMSDTTKIYNFKYPSKYMKNEINKEIKLLQSQGKPTGHLYRLLRRDEEAAYHISHAQREFLERYGYKAWRHKESNVSTKSFVVFRPEQYKIKELSEDILTGPRRLLAEKKKKEDLGTMAFQKIIKKGSK